MTIGEVFADLAILFGTIAVLCALIAGIMDVSRRRRRPSALERFDIATARRESHALGLPFPEADGTLSLPDVPRYRKTDAEVHSEIHARRAVAQFGMTAEEAAEAMRKAFAPKQITSHMPDDQREGWAAMVRERGWTCGVHASCELNTPSCRIVRPEAESIADEVIRALPGRLTKEVFNDLLDEYYRSR